MYNKIIDNTITDKGIAVGAWAPNIWTDNTGTKVAGNQLPNGWLGVTYSTGQKVFAGNQVYAIWDQMADGFKWRGNANHTMPPSWPGWEVP